MARAGIPPELPPEVQEHVDRLVAAAPPMWPELISDLRLIIWGSPARTAAVPHPAPPQADAA